MPKKILVIDDEPGICDVICLNLEAEGYQTECASSGREGLEKIQSAPPDLVILDIMMPEIDGWEVLSHLRADQSTSDIPVILLSAKTEEISKLLGFQLGADDYVTKPFSVKELTARIGIVLARHGEKLLTPLKNHAAGERIAASKEGEQYFLNTEDVFFAAADRNNTYLHTDSERFVIHRNLSFVEKQLPEYFLRVHKSYILNLNRVSKLFSPSRGAYVVELDDSFNSLIPVSRSKVKLLRQLSSKTSATTSS